VAAVSIRSVSQHGAPLCPGRLLPAAGPRSLTGFRGRSSTRAHTPGRLGCATDRAVDRSARPSPAPSARPRPAPSAGPSGAIDRSARRPRPARLVPRRARCGSVSAHHLGRGSPAPAVASSRPLSAAPLAKRR
jgi:hypothetical protein